LARLVASLCAVFFFASAGAVHAATLRVAWDRNSEADVTGYRVLYGTASRVYSTTVDVGNVTTYTLPSLVGGRQYFIAVQAYNRAGLSSALSVEVSALAVLDSTPAAANVLLGMGQQNTNAGGMFGIYGGSEYGYGQNGFVQVPWAAYNTTGGGVRIATGDVDGDGLDEVVVGLGRGSSGWVAVLDDVAHQYQLLRWIQVGWLGYNAANGEVFPAVGNLDGDNREEIVLGLGNGGAGWIQIFDDASANYAPLTWKQVAWGAYNAGPAPTHPAVGDVTGDGVAEIVLGLGRGSAGWMQVLNSGLSNYSSRGWIQIPYAAYNAINGETFPAIGDVDNDGRGEIVFGLGASGGGWFGVFDDANTGFAFDTWKQVAWPVYNLARGELHPAVGNVDADPEAEIVLGLGQFPGSGGWFEVRDDERRGYVSRGWRNLGITTFTVSGGAIFPAVAKR